MLARSLLAAMAACALVPATSASPPSTRLPPARRSGASPTPTTCATSAVAAANGLSPEARVVAGTNLTIPAPGQAPTPPVTPAPSSPGTTAAPAASGGGGYRVAARRLAERASPRARACRLSSLAAANGLKLDSWVIQGTTPEAAGSGQRAGRPGRARAAPGAPEAMGAYKVRPGDTLSGLAAAARVPAAQMAYMNGLNPTAQLVAGTVIKLPTGRDDQRHGAGPGADDRPAGGADGLAGPPERRRRSARSPRSRARRRRWPPPSRGRRAASTTR